MFFATPAEPDYDREDELKSFDDNKTGVKGLVDAGITQVPRIFHQPPDDKLSSTGETQFGIPIIDLGSIDDTQLVEQVREASESLGFFQVVNHGIPIRVLEEMRDGVVRFFEQDDEEKKRWYTRDSSKRVVYNSNFDLYRAPAANWRDTVYCPMGAPVPPPPEELPEACRDIMLEYSKQVMKLGDFLFNLLSKALGLPANYLTGMGCGEGLAMLLHYYPACPQPELTMGTSQHADGDFLTVLLQDPNIGGLQVLHQNKWINVPSIPGALVVNVGDLLQLISNDKFKSVEHRVLANHVGPRVSVACFFTTGMFPSSRVYGPIEELLSEANPPKYKATTVRDYTATFNGKGLHFSSFRMIISYFHPLFARLLLRFVFL